MDVIRYNIESVQFEVVFFNSFFDGIEKNFFVFVLDQFKFMIIVMGGNVVGIFSLKVSRFFSYLFIYLGIWSGKYNQKIIFYIFGVLYFYQIFLEIKFLLKKWGSVVIISFLLNLKEIF